MQIHVEPDLAIPFPEDNPVLANFIEKAQAACNSAQLLGLNMEPTEEDKLVAEEATYAVAQNEEKANKKLVKKDLKPAAYGQVKTVLDAYSTRVVENAMQIRLLVTNKLILDSDSPDDRTRLRALELLGKITDVGLFTEKSEVTINNRSTQDLLESVRAKIQRLMHPVDVEDVKEVKVNGETINLDEELGADEEKPDGNAGN
jgi:predicted ATP-grasp superfamily ATP-dependent carboligase